MLDRCWPNFIIITAKRLNTKIRHKKEEIPLLVLERSPRLCQRTFRGERGGYSSLVSQIVSS